MEMFVICVYFMKIKSTPCSENGSAIQDSHARRHLPRSLIISLLCSALAALASGQPPPSASSGRALTDILNSPELDAGFHFLYELKPSEARAKFDAWQKSHPEDPLGVASEAASYLFEECYRQRVLTSEFFLDDKHFLGKIPLKPNDELRAAFFTANKRAQDMARVRLTTNPQDADALFVMALGVGMQADYASLIDKRQLGSLAMIKEADKYAKELLAIAPDAFDAYVTLGAANYIIGSLPAPKRLFLVFKGIHSDKNTGIQQLEIAAAHGHYLRPFAKILLALAALREKRLEVARTQLRELVAEFPENSLFASELTKINGSSRSGDTKSAVGSSRTAGNTSGLSTTLTAAASASSQRSYLAVRLLPTGSFRPQSAATRLRAPSQRESITVVSRLDVRAQLGRQYGLNRGPLGSGCFLVSTEDISADKPSHCSA